MAVQAISVGSVQSVFNKLYADHTDPADIWHTEIWLFVSHRKLGIENRRFRGSQITDIFIIVLPMIIRAIRVIRVPYLLAVQAKNNSVLSVLSV